MATVEKKILQWGKIINTCWGIMMGFKIIQVGNLVIQQIQGQLILADWHQVLMVGHPQDIVDGEDKNYYII
jgi:hypothetical protein